MARIAGIELNDNWKVDFALTRIKGLGWPLSIKLLDALGITRDRRVKDLTSDEISKITSKLDEMPIEGELARQIKANIQRLQAVGSYRGIRHSRGLPVRGQRTRTNARTKRGKRKTVGAFKKEVLSKMAATKTGEKK